MNTFMNTFEKLLNKFGIPVCLIGLLVFIVSQYAMQGGYKNTFTALGTVLGLVSFVLGLLGGLKGG